MEIHSYSLKLQGLALILILPLWAAEAVELDHAEQQALSRDDGLKALAQREQAWLERAVADGALPDPEIFLGVEGVPVDDPLNADMMTIYMLGFRQQFPPGDSRKLGTRRGQTEATVLASERLARQLEIQREVRGAWLDWAGAALAIEIAEEGLHAFEELLELTEARYRAGTGRQRDVDQARLERALLARQILDLQTRRDEAASALARWTGELPMQDRPDDLPTWPEPRAGLIEDRGWFEHPLIIADRQRIEVGQLDTDIARQGYRPMWMLEAGYGHQRGRDPMNQGRQSDKLFAMVSFSLPLFTANRQDRRLAAAEAETDALDHQRALRLQEWEGRIRSSLTRLAQQKRRIELIGEMILPEAEQTLNSTLTAYRNDQASFDELVRARLAHIDQRLELIETRIRWLLARVELSYLTAEELT